MADNRISIGVKFIALNIGKREIRLTADEALQLRNELDRLLSATAAGTTSPVTVPETPAAKKA